MTRRHKRDRKAKRPNAHISEDNLSFIFGWMEMCDHYDLPDGAWWIVLENGATAALKHLDIRGDAHELVHAYIAHAYPDQDKP